MISERFEGGERVAIITCDRCGMTISDDGIEMQERFAVRFKAGYASVFGDENIVEGDFCQTCIHDVLGQYCRVMGGDPFSSGHRIQGAPENIYQPDQLSKAE